MIESFLGPFSLNWKKIASIIWHINRVTVYYIILAHWYRQPTCSFSVAAT